MARILVIDDQLSITKVLESVLSQHGHVVTSAKDGYEGLEKFKESPFDLVITDVVMPGTVSGFDVAKTVRAEQPGLPIIFLTGRREKRDVDRALEIGVDDYVVKPIDPDLFMAKVSSLLQRKNPAAVTAFVEASLSMEAALNVVLKVTGVSEVGLTLQSAQPLHVGSKISIDCRLFADVGMESPRLRVASCEPTGSEPQPNFRVRVQFIGLTERSLQPLRLWIRSQGSRRAS
jgi:DNA-binding response OmpR family regulator